MTDRCESLRDSIRPPAKPVPSKSFNPARPMSDKAAHLLSVNGFLKEAQAMTDWTEACDPVPARERTQLTEGERRRLAALMELRRAQRIAPADSVTGVDPDFDKAE